MLMLTNDELFAIVELAERSPKSAAEQLFWTSCKRRILAGLAAQLAAPEVTEVPTTVEEAVEPSEAVEPTPGGDKVAADQAGPGMVEQTYFAD